jgi:hypothetical protein
MSGETLIKLINQPDLWSILCLQGEIQASGISSDLTEIITQASNIWLSISEENH